MVILKRSSEDQNVARNVDRKDCAPEVSDGTKDYIGNSTSSHSFEILAKSLSTFCSHFETLWEAEFKGDRPINLVEEILRQSSMQGEAQLLLAAFSQAYSENEEKTQGKKT
jgi:hypothetical protein